MNEPIEKVPMEENEVNLLEILQVIVKHKRFIFKFCGAACVVSLLVSLCLPNSYTATARVLPPQKEGAVGISALLGQMGGLAALAGGGLGGGGDLYLGILKSRSVADAVIKRLDLAAVYKTETPEDTRKKLEKRVKMQLGSKDGIITITAADRDPVRSAQLANTFVDELGKVSVRLNLTKAGAERVFLEQRLAVAREDLRRAEEALRAFSQQHKMVQLDSQARASIEGAARLKAELASKEIQLAALRSYQTDENPDVKVLTTAISRLKGELAAQAGRGGSDDGIPSIGSVPNLGLEYLRKMREQKTQEAIFEQLTKQYELAKLNEAKDTASIQILDEAVVPLKKSKPMRSFIVVLTLVTSFFASLFIIFVRQYFEKMPEDDRKLWGQIRQHVFNFKRLPD